MAMYNYENISNFGWYWLSLHVNGGIQTLEKYVKACGGIEEAMIVTAEKLEKIPFLNVSAKKALMENRDISAALEEYNKLSERGIHFVGRSHPKFPDKLNYIQQRPFGLFYMGSLPDVQSVCVSVVGARNPTPYGREMARKLGFDLAHAGVSVISGMALGIDGAAHRGALEAGGTTFGVLGSGVNICYPKENMDIFERMKSEGGILSEFAPGMEALTWHFPYRNRLISALSDGIVVVEAREKSGSLITANYGLDQGKDIFAVPGRPIDPLSEGCNSLISDGAHLICGAKDVLDVYHIYEELPTKNKLGLADLEKLVYSSLCLDADSIQNIAEKTNLSYAQTAKLLFSLEQKGYASSVGKNQYIRKL